MKTPTNEEMIRRGERMGEIMMTLDPNLPDVIRIVIATDMEHGERLLAAYRKGEITAEQAVHFAGSYFRLTVATTLWGEGALTDEWFFGEWPALWRGSDPDDTDPKYWDIWQTAFAENNGRVLDEGVDLPGKGSRIRIFRGQMPGDPLGCAWSTDEKVARTFANGAGFRAPVRGGVVYKVWVPKGMVLAYLTGRGESEVIIDPRDMGWAKP